MAHITFPFHSFSTLTGAENKCSKGVACLQEKLNFAVDNLYGKVRIITKNLRKMKKMNRFISFASRMVLSAVVLATLLSAAVVDAVAAGGQATPAYKAVWVYSTASDGYVNIREMPVVGSNILGRIKTGGRGAAYLGSTGMWHRVEMNGVEGYVDSRYCQVEGLDKASMRVNGGKGPIYYVVIEEYRTLNEARKATEKLPDSLDGACIYRFNDKDGTVYALTVASFLSRETAQQQVDALSQYLYRQSWILYRPTPAPCVYQGIEPSGEPASLEPR